MAELRLPNFPNIGMEVRAVYAETLFWDYLSGIVKAGACIVLKRFLILK